MEFIPVETNLRDSFRVLAAGRGSGDVREYPGVSIAAVGATFQMFNAAFFSSRVECESELERRILQAAVHFGARGMEWAFWMCESWLDEKLKKRARQAMRKHGLHLSVELPGMIAERLEPPARPLPEIEIRRVARGPDCDAFCAIGSLCFHVPMTWFREVFEYDVWDRFLGYVGYVNSEPVSTAAIVMGGGAAGVYNVATVPPRQRCGYGEAVMRHALAEAAREHGVTRTILQSTPQGLALYERMGYRSVTRVSVYAT